MRYSEIITEQYLLEKISLGSVGRQLRNNIISQLPDEIFKQYKNEYDEIPFYQLKSNPSARSTIDHKEGRMIVRMWIGMYIRRTLTQVAQQQTPSTMLTVKFEQIVALGDYNHPKQCINLNSKFLDSIVNAVYNKLYNSFVDSNFKIIKLSSSELGVDFYVTDMIETFVHELTHAQQFTRAGKLKNIYRSYLIKSKQQFEKVMAEVENSVHKNNAYLSSPEEIGAFAQDTAYRLCTPMLHTDANFQKEYVTHLMKQLSTSGTPYFSLAQSNNPILQKSARRFLKKVYQELADTLEQITNNTQQTGLD